MKDIYLAKMLTQQPSSLSAARVLTNRQNIGPNTSSPHIVDRAWLGKRLAWNSVRAGLLDKLYKWIDEFGATGACPEMIMLGGSFVSNKEQPKDIDGLLIYSVPGEADMARIRELSTTRREGLDIRIVPCDSSPVMLIKTVCFYHTLYEGQYEQGRDKEVGKGSIIVALKGD